MNPDATERAFAAHPELRLLAQLRNGWSFTHDREDGELVRITGIHPWFATGGGDAILVRDSTDVLAVRTNRHNEIVWQKDGDLVEVVHGLLALPPPSHRLAPRLARSGIAPTLWVPGQRPGGVAATLLLPGQTLRGGGVPRLVVPR